MNRPLLSCCCFLFLTSHSHSQTATQSAAAQASPSPQRDPQAVALVQQAVKAMGGSAPSDSTAAGTINLVAGSQNENGTITILTKGSAETSEQINLPSGQRGVIFSSGLASESTPSNSGQVVMQLAVTDQCVDFPLPFLVAALANSDQSFLYVGQDSLNGAAVQHLQTSNSFASRPALSRLAPFSTMDLWFDAASGLPLKITYTRRAGGGTIPGIPVEVSFSNYANFGGVLYPMQIQKSYNGTPWQTITIQSVTFNTGLTDAQFQVQ